MGRAIGLYIELLCDLFAVLIIIGSVMLNLNPGNQTILQVTKPSSAGNQTFF